MSNAARTPARRLHVLGRAALPAAAALVLLGGVAAATVVPGPPDPSGAGPAAVARDAPVRGLAAGRKPVPTTGAAPAGAGAAVPAARPPAPPAPTVDGPDTALAPPADPLGPPPGPQPEAAPVRTAAPADRYAFLVGVQDYRAPTHDTVGGRADVLAVRRALLDAGWRPENVRTVVDGDATGAAVRAGLAWLAARSRPGTFALFHWSGHVMQLGAVGSAGSTVALWPVDRDVVGDREVVRALQAAAGRLWVDVAGCEAAAFLPGLPSARVLVTASSRADQKSYEHPAWGTSVWTGLLLQGLAGAADLDGDGRATVGEAVRWAGYQAQRVTLTQRPYGRQTPQSAGARDRGFTLADPPA